MKTKFGQKAFINNSVSNSSVKTDNSKIVGRVVDIILDSSHPLYNDYNQENGIGTVFFIDPTLKKNSQSTNVAQPIFFNQKFFPLINELVEIVVLPSVSAQNEVNNNQYYYLNPINVWNHPHINALPLDVDVAPTISQQKDYIQIELGSNKVSNSSITELNLGNTFKEKSNIHPIQPFEGDYILEGRWGNSIRLGSTVINKNNWSTSGKNGDPILILRNGQGKQSDEGWKYIIEDINNDDNSLYFTSTQQIPINVSNKEYKNFFTIPIAPPNYNKKQIILNSGRLLFNTTEDNILLSSNKSIGLNSNEDIVLQSKNTIISGTNNFIGSKNASQPLLLGKDTVDILKTVFNSLKELSDSLIALAEILPAVPNAPVNIKAAELSVELQNALISLPKLLSKNNFTE